jgi:hypothetical protein
MDANAFKDIFSTQYNKTNILDYLFVVNDSIFESNYIHPFCIENAINSI